MRPCTRSASSSMRTRTRHLVHQDSGAWAHAPHRARWPGRPPSAPRLRVATVKAWDLRELRERIADGFTLRYFTTVRQPPRAQAQGVPPRVLSARPGTVRALNDAVVRRPSALGLEDGSDCASTPPWWRRTSIGPTDAGLLWDAVRVLTRLVKRLGERCVPSARRGFADHTRRARRRMQEIHRLTPKERQDSRCASTATPRRHGEVVVAARAPRSPRRAPRPAPIRWPAARSPPWRRRSALRGRPSG